jgi:uncharacterized membrane protein
MCAGEDVDKLFLIRFEDEHAAFLMHTSLIRLHRQYPIQMEHVIVVARSEQGKLTVYKVIDFNRPPPEHPIGATINSEFRATLEQTVRPGTSALFFLTASACPQSVLDMLRSFQGKSSLVTMTEEQADELSTWWSQL